MVSHNFLKLSRMPPLRSKSWAKQGGVYWTPRSGSYPYDVILGIWSPPQARKFSVLEPFPPWKPFTRLHPRGRVAPSGLQTPGCGWPTQHNDISSNYSRIPLIAWSRSERDGHRTDKRTDARTSIIWPIHGLSRLVHNRPLLGKYSLKLNGPQRSILNF